MENPASAELNNSKNEVQRRDVLKMLAVGGAAMAAAETAEANPMFETKESWRQRMHSKEISEIVNHPDVAINEDFTYRLSGVAHIPETLIQNFDEIGRNVDDSSLVILEYFDQRVPEIAQEIASSEGDLLEAVENTTYSTVVNDNSSSFFAGVAGIAARKGKDVVMLNPETDAARKFTAMFGGTNGILGGGITLAAIATLFGTEITKKHYGMTRRDFLRRGALAAGGMTGANVYMQGEHKQKQEYGWLEERGELVEVLRDHLDNMNHAGLVDPKDALPVRIEKLHKCFLDWRDATTALGILKMAGLDGEKEEDDPTRYSQEGKPIVHYEGSYHAAVLHYLGNPEEAEERLGFYDKTFNLEGNMSIRRFRFNKGSEAFEMISDIPIQDRS